MHEIILISTVHREYGNCNSDELVKIIDNIRPDVIFLEASKDDYSEYDHLLFSQFGAYNERLELKAMQMYSENHDFKYVPVLDVRLSDEFYAKIRLVSENKSWQILNDNYSLLQNEGGFQFLNSEQSVVLHEEMRELEKKIINNEVLRKKVDANIDEYEYSMLRNIYAFCKENQFSTAIFMCGSAHRKSIIEKIGEFEEKSEIQLNWTHYDGH